MRSRWYFGGKRDFYPVPHQGHTLYASEIPHLTRGMRHLDLAEMLIKEKVESKEIKLLTVASGDNTSDLGTKRLALPLFNKLTSRIIDKSLRVNL